MSLEVGPYVFEQVQYDADGDVLYANVDDRRGGEPVATGDPQHTFFAIDGVVHQLDLVSPRAELSRLGAVSVALPGGGTAKVIGLESVLRQPA